MVYQHTFEVQTKGRDMLNITPEVIGVVSSANLEKGLCNVFLHHTSASLILCENADPIVQQDLNAFFERLVPDGDKLFKHIAEGVDDMSAHVRTILTQSSISIPIFDDQLDLGAWQGIYLWEHRFKSFNRRVTVTVLG